MRRPLLITALFATLAAGVAACGGGGGNDSGRGDPKCFAKDAENATCTSSEGVIYRVVDRDATGSIPGALTVRLADGPRPATPTTVSATVRLKPRGPYDGDVALQQAKGTLYVPKTRVRKGDRLTLSWTLPLDAIKKLYEYPSYVTFFQSPDKCPGGKAQCFVYIRLFK
jgi:hypothetical protein